MRWSIPVLVYALILLPQVHAERYILSPEGSRLEVFVPRAGFLSMLGHDHTIAVEDFEGTVELDKADPAGAQIRLQVPVKSMRVVDEGVSEDTREKIDEEMRGEAVLHQEAHPLIEFSSTKVTVAEPGVWRVSGALSVAGVNKPVSFSAEIDYPDEQSISADATLSLKPEIFGIEPVKALGGAIRTARTIEIRFQVRGMVESGGSD